MTDHRRRADEAVRMIVHKHRRRAFKESCDPKLMMLKEETADIIEAFASALKEVEVETWARAVDIVGGYSAKYRRYLKDAKERSDVIDAVEFAHKDIAADEILSALREEAAKK